MTPAEFHSLLDARGQDRRQDREYLNNLNARLCEIIVKAPYIKDPTERIPEDFLIFPPPDIEKKEEEVTPEQWEDYLELIALTYKGPEV